MPMLHISFGHCILLEIDYNKRNKWIDLKKYNFLPKKTQKICWLNSAFPFILYLWIRIHITGLVWIRIFRWASADQWRYQLGDKRLPRVILGVHYLVSIIWCPILILCTVLKLTQYSGYLMGSTYNFGLSHGTN